MFAALNDAAIFDRACGLLDEFSFSNEPTPELGMLWGYHKAKSKSAAVISPATASQQLIATVRGRDDLSVKEKKSSVNRLLRLQKAVEIKATEAKRPHDIALAQQALTRYATELALAQFSSLINPLHGVVADAEALASQLVLRLSQISSATSDSHILSDFSNLDPLVLGATHTEKCGIPAIDSMLNGGQAPQEVYAFGGPTGSCKTTTAVQMATAQAKRFAEEYRAEVKAYNLELKDCRERKVKRRKGLLKPVRRVVHVFSYEDDQNSMQVRILSCAASILSERLKSMPGDVLTNPEGHHANPIAARMSKGSGDLQPYERSLYQAQISVSGLTSVPGELQRHVAAVRNLNHHLVLHDMRGGSKSGVGLGGVFELSGCLSSYLAAHPDTKVGSVFIDYAKLMISKFMDASGLSKLDQLRTITSAYPMQIKNNVAEKFHCPVWVLQQLDAGANALAAGKTANKTAWPEAKDFLENMNFGFIASSVVSDGSFVVVSCVKHRRGPDASKAVLHLRGNMCQIHEAPGMTVTSGGQVLTRAEAGRLEPAGGNTGAVPMTPEQLADGYMMEG